MTAAIELSADGFLQQINEYECIRDLGVGATAEVCAKSVRSKTLLCFGVLRMESCLFHVLFIFLSFCLFSTGNFFAFIPRSIFLHLVFVENVP